jgi:hypothetical protein
LCANLNAKGLNNGRPLYIAAGNNFVEAARLLVEMGADKEAQDIHGYRPMHVCAEVAQEPAMISTLAELGADVEAKNAGDMRPLHLAATNAGDMGVVENVRTLVIQGGREHRSSQRGGRDAAVRRHWRGAGGASWLRTWKRWGLTTGRFCTTQQQMGTWRCWRRWWKSWGWM